MHRQRNHQSKVVIHVECNVHVDLAGRLVQVALEGAVAGFDKGVHASAPESLDFTLSAACSTQACAGNSALPITKRGKQAARHLVSTRIHRVFRANRLQGASRCILKPEELDRVKVFVRRNVETLSDLDRRSVLHPFTHAEDYADGKVEAFVAQSGVVVRSRGVDGMELLDGIGGLYCVNVGCGRPEVVAAIVTQARSLRSITAMRAARVNRSRAFPIDWRGWRPRGWVGSSTVCRDRTPGRDHKGCGR